MLEILVVAVLFLPYIAIGKTLKIAKNYCKKNNWILAEETLKVVGLPFSLYDDVY